jgi:TadE-like protein
MSRGEAMRTRSQEQTPAKRASSKPYSVKPAGLAAISFRRLPRRFADDSRGSAAAEFCIILPVILIFVFGLVEVCNVISVSRKLTLTAHTISDMVGQATAINDEGVKNVLEAGKVLLQPYPNDPDVLFLRISAVQIDANKQATVVWSDAEPSTEKRGNGAVTIPPALLIPDTQLIWGEVSYKYKPNLGSFTLKTPWSYPYERFQSFSKPRESSTVCRSSCS